MTRRTRTPSRPPRRDAAAIVLALVVAPVLGATIARADDRADPFPASTPESQGLSSAKVAELVDVVRGFVERDSILGGELLVVKNRHTVVHEAFGVVDREAQRPWTANTICNLRSMTKTFTGAAAQILIDRGQLRLDDRVSAWLPGFETEASKDITIDQLLTHRSGLPLSIMMTRADMGKYASLFEQSNAVGAAGPEFAPGSKFWYSDAGSDALAAVVERVAGCRIDEFWTRELFGPLGMSDTFVPLRRDDERTDRIATLYAGQAGAWMRVWGPDEPPLYPYGWGSQTAYGTAIDYARFLAMWMDRGASGDRRVLSEDAVARTLTPMAPMSMLGADARFPTDFPGLEVWYGRMAVLHVPTDDPAHAEPVIIGHSGSDGTIAWAWPERDLMILLFTQSRGSTAVLRLEDHIDRLILHPDRAETAAEIPERFRPYVGTYLANFAAYRDTPFEVLVKNGTLALDIPTQMVFELLEPDADGRWRFAIAPEAVSVSFDAERDGRFEMLRMHQAGMTFDVPRAGTAAAEAARTLATVDPDEVAPLLGAYFHPEAQANVVVELAENVLCLRAPTGVVFHFVPGADGVTWTLKEAPGLTLTFEFDDAGEVVSMTRHAGGADLVMPRQR